jgi:hypothetical protein
MFMKVAISEEIKKSIMMLRFKSCQNCSDENPDMVMDYPSYVKHLLTECDKI